MPLALALPIVLGVLLFATNPYFTLLEDEAQITRVAKLPASVVVEAFEQGSGLHEHPPLSDLLLHRWISLGAGSVNALRSPFILCYIAGIFVLALLTRRFAGDPGLLSLIAIAALWPFGFHFGRLIGWYSFAFLLVSLLTFFYARFVAAPRWYWWAAWMVTAIALLYTNYAGLAFIALLAADLIVFEGKAVPHGLRIPLLLTPVILALAFSPLWNVFSTLAHRRVGSATATGALANFAYAGYAAFVSESVAPWFFALSIPAAVAVICVGVTVLLGSRGLPRRLFLYFGILLGAFAAVGILNTKRLLFLCPWLLVAIATTAGKASQRKRITLIAAMSVIAAIGWYGILDRSRYASPHFLEPWPQVANDVAPVVRNGDTVIASHPALFFYLGQILAASDIPIGEAPDVSRARYKVFDAAAWVDSGSPLSPAVVLVQSVSVPGSAYIDEAEKILAAHCTLQSDRKLARDPGYQWKERLFPNAGQREWRIEILQYDCAPLSRQ